MRTLTGLILVTGLLLPAIQPNQALAQAKPPALQMRLGSLDSLMETFYLLADRVGRKEEAKQLEQVLKAGTGPEGIQGLDPKRPLGLYGSIGPNGVDSEAVLAVPSLDEEKMLAAVTALAGGLGGKVEKGKNGGAHVLNLDQSPFPIYFRFEKKYCWATLRDESIIAPAKLPDPEVFLKAPQPGSLVSLKFDLSGVPDNLRQLAVDQLKEKMSEAKDQAPPDETAKQKALRLQIANGIEEGLVSFLKEGGSLSVEIGHDKTTDELFMGTELLPKPGTALAKSWNSLTNPETIGGAMAQKGSVLALSMNMKVPESLLQPFGAALEEMRDQTLAKEKDSAKKELGKSMFESMMPTLKAGKLDMGMAFIPSKGDDHLSMLLGLRVEEGAKVEELVRKLAAVPTKPDDDKVTLDVGKLGGIALHKVEPGPNGDKDAQELLGKGPGFFAVRPDAVILGAGPEGMNLLKEGIEAKNSPSPLLSMGLSFSQFSRFNNDRNIPKKKIEEAAKKAFGDKPESDRLKLLVESKDGMRFSLRLKSAVLTFFSELDPNKAN
jgi:hypothetical protein